MSATHDLAEQVERQRETIERLERKVDALASELDVEFAGACSRCEEGLTVYRDGALTCTSCAFARAL